MDRAGRVLLLPYLKDKYLIFLVNNCYNLSVLKFSAKSRGITHGYYYQLAGGTLMAIG